MSVTRRVDFFEGNSAPSSATCREQNAMSLKARVSNLEKRSGGRCPFCPPLRIVYESDFYPEARPSEAPAACSYCGRPAAEVRVTFVEDFYRNAERINEGTAET
jgi:hypothetical protein